MRSALRNPGRWILLATVMLAVVGGFVWAIPYNRDRAAELLVERLGGRVMRRTSAPDWLVERLPESWHWLCESIEGVDLAYSEVDGDDLPELVERLVGLSELHALYLSGTDLDDDDAPHLARLKRLEILALSGTRIGDEGVRRLAPLDRLEWLALDGTRITDAGLKHLAAFSRLELLDLDGTDISDEGIATLDELPRLSELNVSNTGVSESTLHDLGSRMPTLNSVWDD